MDRVDHLKALLEDEIDNGMEHRVWEELSDVITNFSIKEHLVDLENASSVSDVAEACIEYLDDLRDRLKSGQTTDDLAAKWLGVEVENNE